METENITLDDQLNSRIVGTCMTLNLGTPITSLHGKVHHVLINSQRFVGTFIKPIPLALMLTFAASGVIYGVINPDLRLAMSNFLHSHTFAQDTLKTFLPQDVSQPERADVQRVEQAVGIEKEVPNTTTVLPIPVVGLVKGNELATNNPIADSPLPPDSLGFQDGSKQPIDVSALNEVKVDPFKNIPKQTTSNPVKKSSSKSIADDAAEEKNGHASDIMDFTTEPLEENSLNESNEIEVPTQESPPTKLIPPEIAGKLNVKNKSINDSAALTTSKPKKEATPVEESTNKAGQTVAKRAINKEVTNKLANRSSVSDEDFLNNAAFAQPVNVRGGPEPVAAKEVSVSRAPSRMVVEVVDIDPAGKFVLVTDPKTMLPIRYVIGQKLHNGQRVNSIDPVKGQIKAGKETYKMN